MFRDQNADSPAEVRLSRSGDIFLRLVPSNPAGKRREQHEPRVGAQLGDRDREVGDAAARW